MFKLLFGPVTRELRVMLAQRMLGGVAGERQLTLLRNRFLSAPMGLRRINA